MPRIIVTAISTLRFRPARCAGALLFLAVQLAIAQTFSSSITGLVTDPSGAAVVGAKVELKNTDTNDVHADTSRENGLYQFNNLNPGTYQITVAAPAFKTHVQQNLSLHGFLGSSRTQAQFG